MGGLLIDWGGIIHRRAFALFAVDVNEKCNMWVICALQIYFKTWGIVCFILDL